LNKSGESYAEAFHNTLRSPRTLHRTHKAPVLTSNSRGFYIALHRPSTISKYNKSTKQNSYEGFECKDDVNDDRGLHDYLLPLSSLREQIDIIATSSV
jgi:hypothetical protein